MAAVYVPARALWLRAFALELERLANHLGDIGAMGNDAGFAFGLAQFSRLKERLLRATERALGQRYLMDFVVPGGTRVDLELGGARCSPNAIEAIAAEVATLRTIYDDHAGLRDRFVGAGIVAPALAAKTGPHGLAGRASGQAFDLRFDLPCDPYRRTGAQKGRARAKAMSPRALQCASMRRLSPSHSFGSILSTCPGGAHRTTIAAPARTRSASD